MNEVKPIRMCIACRKRAEQDTLVWFSPDSRSETPQFIVIDNSSLLKPKERKAKAQRRGRGAYIHPTEKCASSLHEKSLSKAFRRSISKTVREKLQEQLLERKMVA